MRKAKIVCTLGPASSDLRTVLALARAGMDAARLNFSHGTPPEHRRRVKLVREAAARCGRPLAVLQDIQGPKLRVGVVERGEVHLVRGERVTVTTRDVVGCRGLLPTTYQHLPRDVRRGDELFVDDGRVRLRVVRVGKTDVVTHVIQGGAVRDHKGINLPGVAVSAPTLTAKDKEDLAFGRSLGVDYVALSFVRSARDVLTARALLGGEGGTPIIAKVERPEAVEDLDAIAAAADGIMVARGDLGVELRLERVPLVQKDAIDLVNRHSKLVIVATEMLESMIHEPRPTRAEVSDVANAILDGADAVMLSGETAVGAHPVAVVTAMARIIAEVEASPRYRQGPRPHPDRTPTSRAAVACAACAASGELGLRTIVAHTVSGATARAVSEFRPEARVVALTPRPATYNRTALYWGVTPILVERCASTDDMLRLVSRILVGRRLGRRGETVAVVAGAPVNRPGSTNLLTLHRL